MITASSSNDFFKSKVLGHPAGLFVLFFTEMWERFSYYGMRALLVLFLTTSIMDLNPGWGWPRENALALYGSYTSLAYLTTILGGYFADKVIGYRWAVVLGATLMTLGHASMAVETQFFMYLGLALLVVGNGFFKPNMTSIVSNMYKDHQEKKDGAYTIFYMGVNAGAFLGIMLCGYLGENVSWSWGFGLAGIFMFFGMLQFYFSRNIFGDIGLKPEKKMELETTDSVDSNVDENGDKLNPFTKLDLALIAFVSIIGLVWIINDPLYKISGFNIFNFTVMGYSGDTFSIVLAVAIFVFILISRIVRYSLVTRQRMVAVIIFAFFTIFFWAAFEQAGGSMTIFAGDYTNRLLEGGSAMAFKTVDTIITIVPLGIITYVLIKLFRQTFAQYALANIILSLSFVIIWGIVIWKLMDQFAAPTTEVPASWFGILNSLFIITLAPLFSKIWESKYNPSGAVKFGIGLILLGLGFAFLAYGSSDIPQGAKVASVSMVWLIFAYLFHTLGELCISPVGLSYVSKLVPARMIAIMFGIWYLAIAIGNKTAGTMGGKIDQITAQYSLSAFFLIFTLVPMAGGVILFVLNPLLKKLMHGVR